MFPPQWWPLASLLWRLRDRTAQLRRHARGGARPGHADIWGNSRVEKQNSESLADLQFLHNSEIEAVTRQVHL